MPKFSLKELRGVARLLLAITMIACWQISTSGVSAADTNSASIDKRQQVNKISSADSATPSTIQETASVLQTEDTTALRDKWESLDNPERDGWETEALTTAALQKLKKIGKFIEQVNAASPGLLNGVAANKFRCTSLLPDHLLTVYQDQTFEVQRAESREEERNTDAMAFQGESGLQMAVRGLCKPFATAGEIRTKFKIFRVNVEGEQAITRQYVEIIGLKESGCIEQHATWEARWTINPDKGPLLESLKTIDFEQVQSKVPGGPLFADCTTSVLSKNRCFADQFQRGYGYWMLGVPYTRYQITEMMGHPGIAIADINGDQLEDLYVCQEQGLPNRLFLQQQDGTALEVAHQWGCDWLQASRSALFVDLDNDGDQDLVTSFLGGIIIASNEGNAFQVRSVLPTGDDMVALAAADIEDDGDVDIYTTAYYADKQLSERQSAGLPASGNAFVYHDANVGGTNRLLRNDISGEEWSFTDVTKPSGLDANNTRFSFAAAWEDYDNDGDQDLYVANDYGRDNLYRNDNGTFKDIAAVVGAEDAASGMSVSWSDYDHDGRMDIYISNMWSAAGNRIAFQPDFKKNAPPEVKQRLQRFARGNTLLRNESDSQFEDVSKKAGVEMGRWAWGSLFADINNDGWDDILIANGFITKNADSGDL